MTELSVYMPTVKTFFAYCRGGMQNQERWPRESTKNYADLEASPNTNSPDKS